MTRTRLPFALAFAALALTARWAGAAQPTRVETACPSERRQLCAQARTYNEFHDCLARNRDSLGPACRSEFNKFLRRALRAYMLACVVDEERFCAEAEPGKTRIADCLKRNYPRLTRSCREQLAKSPHVP